jgi:bifunctional DNA-binding transcriptional regulator/antitoxin component of YhaV-PrlF toxin-antitoxin module
VIPRQFRDKYAIGKKTKIEWIDTGNGMVLIPLSGDAVKQTRGILKGKKNYLASYLQEKQREIKRNRTGGIKGGNDGGKR